MLNDLAGMAGIEGDYRTAVSLYEEGLALFRELGDKRGIAVSLMGLGAIGIGIGAARGAEGPTKRRRREEAPSCWEHLRLSWKASGSPWRQ